RTTSPTEGWHRLATASRGVIIVRTPDGQWSAPTRNAVWVSDGARAEIETCAQTSLEILYIRSRKASWSRGGVLPGCRAVAGGAFLRALRDQVVRVGSLDRRVDADVALAALMLHEVRQGASEPQELVWPRDPRVARVASMVQAKPGDDRRLKELCRGQGVS